jgi:hypothetical protein
MISEKAFPCSTQKNWPGCHAFAAIRSSDIYFSGVCCRESMLSRPASRG